MASRLPARDHIHTEFSSPPKASMDNPTPKAQFEAICYIAGLAIPSTAWNIGRELLILPQRKWKPLLELLAAHYPEDTPEHETVATLQRIVCGETELTA